MISKKPASSKFSIRPSSVLNDGIINAASCRANKSRMRITAEPITVTSHIDYNTTSVRSISIPQMGQHPSDNNTRLSQFALEYLQRPSPLTAWQYSS